jgi:hypothetical protein
MHKTRVHPGEFCKLLVLLYRNYRYQERVYDFKYIRVVLVKIVIIIIIIITTTKNNVIKKMRIECVNLLQLEHAVS